MTEKKEEIPRIRIFKFKSFVRAARKAGDISDEALVQVIGEIERGPGDYFL